MTFTEPFSFDTIENFDEHINRSIPNYDLLQEAILSISEFVTIPNTAVIDLGCSTGTLLKRMKHNGRKVGIDCATNLLPMHTNTEEFYIQDLREINLTKWGDASLITSIFTLQFLPKSERGDILREIYHALCKHGFFIWAEKVMCDEGWQQEITTFSYYDFKRKKFSGDEILSKEQDLRPLMRCNTTYENQRLAEIAGFQNAQMIWKFYNFECWLYRKD